WEEVVYDGSTQAECGTFRDIGGKQRESFLQSGKSKPPPGSKIRIADFSYPNGDMDLASEFPGLLWIILSTYTRTVSEDEYLELRQQIRVELWIGALQLAYIKQDKCFPTQEQRANRFVFGDEGEPTLEDLREYREAMLGLAGVSELKPDLDHLLRKEQHLERAYRKLLEHVQQHARELAVENLEIAVPKAEVLTTGQSSANLCPALIASSGFNGQEMVNLYPQTPVAETGDLIDFSAEEEQPDEPPAEELLSGPKFTELCPAPTVASAFLKEEVVGLSPTTLTGTSEDLVTEQRVQDLCPTLLVIPETGDLIDISVEEEPPSKPPAEVLATGQRVQDLCPTPVAVSEAQGDKVAITSQQQIQGETGEEVCVVPPQQLARVEEADFPPQQRSVHLGDSTIDMSSQQPDEGMEKEATGSPPQWQLHSLGVEEASLLPQCGGCVVPSRSAGNRAECYQPLSSTGNNCGDPGSRGSRPLSPATS
ncbi:hypothetical protein AB205_0105900, partial [Aquarana catesbeiana]